MSFTFTPLIGERVRLEPLRREHLEGLWEAGQAAEIYAYMPIHITSREEMARFIEKALLLREKGTDFPFVIVEQATGRIVGCTRYLDIQMENRNLEIGWTWLNPSVWRTRVNTECKYLLLCYAFETLGCLRVQLKTDGRNFRSQQAIERIGGVREGVLRRQRILHDGYVRDTVYYSILDDEWPAIKQRLEGWLTSERD